MSRIETVSEISNVLYINRKEEKKCKHIALSTYFMSTPILTHICRQYLHIYAPRIGLTYFMSTPILTHIYRQYLHIYAPKMGLTYFMSTPILTHIYIDNTSIYMRQKWGYNRIEKIM